MTGPEYLTGIATSQHTQFTIYGIDTSRQLGRQFDVSTRHMSVAQRWFGCSANDGRACTRGRKPCGRLRTYQPFSWKIRCTVFLFIDSRLATVR